MLQIKHNHKNDIAIVAVGYNRKNSLKRLFSSLQRAHYNHSVPLVISIDCSGDKDLYEYVNNFDWPYGDKYVNIQTERLGLKNHIIQCGNLTTYFKGVIILEDDIFVSEYFYSYVEQVVNFYYDDDRISCISLYRNEMQGEIGLPVISAQDGTDVFLKQSVASWGQCWTDKMWNGFIQWYENENSEDFSKVDMPDFIKRWTKAWSKYYISYEIQKNKYCIFPSVSHTTCFCEAGENAKFASLIGQVTLLSGPKRYNFVPFEQMTKYDIYGSNLEIADWLQLSRDELIIDLYGNNANFKSKRYLLSPFAYAYEIVRGFEMSLRPIELNIKYQLEGNDIFLYDTTKPSINKNKVTDLPLSFAYYHLRSFNFRLLIRYIVQYIISAFKRKMKL